MAILFVVWPGIAGTRAGADEPVTPEQARFFETRIRPILVEHCQGCHGPKKQEAGLRLDSRAALLKGTDAGAVVETGKPDESSLIEAIRHENGLKMPPEGKLPDAAIADLTEWVRQGLPWPEAAPVKSPAESAGQHWAFQPVREPQAPVVKDATWPRSPLDQYVLAKLEAEGLKPAAQADKRTLLRRASFDLLGLPPTPEELSAFDADASPMAFATVVDRLLTSPHYGERWARHWLDVARYADNKGYVFFEEQNYPWAYAYRDYVVRAFNEDLPYDQFIIQQLAADQLDLGADKRPLTALGFLTVGGHFMGNVHDIQDDRIDVVTRGLQGLTVACARCHDHKFDAIPQADYYSLYGVFRSSVEPLMPPTFLPTPETEESRKFEAELQVRLKKLADFVTMKHQNLVNSARVRVAEYLMAAYATRDKPSTEDFMLISNPDDPHPLVILRWWVFLDKTRRGHDPVWSLWHAFAALPEAEFAAKSVELCAELSAKQALPNAADKRVNPILLAALLEKPPQTMAEVAERFAAVLKETDQQWQALVAQTGGGAPAPVALPDLAREQLRQVLYGADAPPNVPLLSGWGFLSLLPDRPAQGEYQKILKEVEQWSMTGPGAPARAMVLEDQAEPFEPRIFLRGNPNRLGNAVPRQFLGAVRPNREPFQHGSGRLELARQIVDPANPLTARVMVNRVWAEHFGAGLVRTPSDFGVRSEPPSHPELLDWLATRFVKQGWSLKALHREILLSATWQQAGTTDDVAAPRQDPENRWLWHMPPRRLDFEGTRDALLAVSGTLDRTLGGPPVQLLDFPSPPRRTLYGFIDRLNTQGLLRTFDVPSPDTSSPQRDTTTVAAQALFLLNGPFSQDCAKKLLARPEVAAETAISPRTEKIYQLLLSRKPTGEELQLATSFLGENLDAGSWERYVHGLLLTNEFVFVD